MGRKKWRERRREGEEREEIDFASSCKYSCGRPGEAQQLQRRHAFISVQYWFRNIDKHWLKIANLYTITF